LVIGACACNGDARSVQNSIDACFGANNGTVAANGAGIGGGNNGSGGNIAINGGTVLAMKGSNFFNSNSKGDISSGHDQAAARPRRDFIFDWLFLSARSCYSFEETLPCFSGFIKAAESLVNR
jgi:hypothetical protein